MSTTAKKAVKKAAPKLTEIKETTVNKETSIKLETPLGLTIEDTLKKSME